MLMRSSRLRSVAVLLFALPVLPSCRGGNTESHAKVPPAAHSHAPLASHPASTGSDTVPLTGLMGVFDTIGVARPHGEQFELSLYNGGLVARIARYGAGRPQVGRYPLGPLNRENPGGRFYVTYHAVSDDTVRTFVSAGGELVITASSPERLEGWFRFRGAEYSVRSGADGDSSGWDVPSTVAPDAPTVEVVGTFTSTRLNKRVCRGTGGPSVLVEMRDPWGRPAAYGTSIAVQQGAFRDSVDGTRAASELYVGAGQRRPGSYQVRLRKPGYRPVVLHDVEAPPKGDPGCRYAEPTDIRRVTLELLPNAPPVRSVVVLPPATLLGIPGYEQTMGAIVDATPGVSQAVRWTSSDTTVATVSASGLLRSQCRRTPGDATITAASDVDPRVRGTASIWLHPLPLDALTGADHAKAKACLARMGSSD
jgi:hypothetical protein